MHSLNTIQQAVGQPPSPPQPKPQSQRVASGLQDNAKKADSLMDKIINSPDLPDPPKLKSLTDGPKEEIKDPGQVFQSFAPTLAVIGSLFTRNHLVNSMTAMSEAMKGYQEGNTEQYQRKREEWKDSTEAAIRQNEQEVKEYELAIGKNKGDVSKMTAQLHSIAISNQNKVLENMLASGNVQGAIDYISHIGKAGGSLKGALPKPKVLTAKQQQDLTTAETQTDDLIATATELRDRIKEDKMLVGGRGLLHRAEQRVSGQFGKGMHPEATQFQSDVENFKKQLTSSILRSKYFSGPAAKAIDELVEGMGRFDDPQTAMGSFDSLIKTLNDKKREISGGQSDAPTDGTQDFTGDYTEDELRDAVDKGIVSREDGEKIARENGWIQ